MKADYAGLAHWHYRAGRPIGVTRVLAARFDSARAALPAAGAAASGNGTVIGVLVETRPVLNCGLRNVALPGRYVGSDRRAAARRLNAEMRTIARVVIAPRFRGIGLATALVRRCLATADVPRVEVLASMGRTQPFFAAAGMTRYDRPMPAESVRLLAALREEGLTAGDLATLASETVSAFLTRELVRFWRSGRHPRAATKHKDAKHTKGHEGDEERNEVLGRDDRCSGRSCTVAEAIADAQRRVLSWPAYYVWQNPAAGLTAPAAPGDPAEMPEALTFFLPAREKSRVLSALRGIDPKLPAALRRCVDFTTKNAKEAKTHDDMARG